MTIRPCIRNAVCIAVTAMAMSAAFAHAEQDRQQPVQTENRLNAATWYRRAFEKYQAVRTTSPENMALWRFQTDPGMGPSPAVRQFLHRIGPALNLTRRAAHQQIVDFATDAQQDGDASFQHLGELRTLHWLIGHEVQYRLAEGDRYGAGDRLATMYRMANHASADAALLGSLVGHAMFEAAERQMKSALDHAAIGQSEAATLLRALQQFDSKDPFRLQRAIENERAETTAWMLQQFSGEGGVERFREEIDELPFANNAATTDEMESLDQAQLESDLRSADRMMQRVVEAFAKPEKELVLAELAHIHEQAQEGEFGTLAPHLLWENIEQYTSLLGTREIVSSRVANLRALADGTRDPMDLANAAVWYMRAIATLPRLDPQKFEKVREYAAVHDAEPSAELIQTLESAEAQDILAHLAQATRIERCDFSYSTPSWPAVVRRYHPGMRDLARLLVADAARLIHSGQESQYTLAAQRIIMTNRLCGHLANDKSIVSSFIAHAAFKENDSLAAAATEARYIHGESLKDVTRSVRFRAADPFGYEAAITAMREDVEKRLLRLVPSPENGSPLEARKFLTASTPDRLLWLQVIFDQGERALGRGAAGANLYLRNLDEVITAEAFHDSMAQSDIVRRMIAEGDFQPLAAFEFPVIADLVKKQEEAFSDLRATLARIKATR